MSNCDAKLDHQSLISMKTEVMFFQNQKEVKKWIELKGKK